MPAVWHLPKAAHFLANVQGLLSYLLSSSIDLKFTPYSTLIYCTMLFAFTLHSFSIPYTHLSGVPTLSLSQVWNQANNFLQICEQLTTCAGAN